MKNDQYSKLCVRGLMDTDGGVYFHKHTTNGNDYTHFGICFTNKSIPLTDLVFKWLEKICASPKKPKPSRVYVYNLKGVKKYFRLIGSSNPKHNNRFKEYLSLSGR